ncbi:hypothetical protein C2W62_33650 [Candidatus Entotheonella serta]|nr:hypothetical protein C2W62_33650 [Candidatus Entotheonella serta]
MSILDFPRIHFSGYARVHAPTGHRNGLLDVSTNTAFYADGRSVTPCSDPLTYHEYLDRLGPRFNAHGQWDEHGPFSMAKGWDFGGPGHFSIDAKVISTQVSNDAVNDNDALVGRDVQMWGHYNHYLGTTFNRARVFEPDPASQWTTTVHVGHLTMGRQGASHDLPNLLSAPVRGMQPPRWQDNYHLRDLPQHCLNREFQRATLYQFAVPKDVPDLLWHEDARSSDALVNLQEVMNNPDVLGFAAQFSLSNMTAPAASDQPSHFELHGTLGPWRRGNPRRIPMAACSPRNTIVTARHLTTDHCLTSPCRSRPQASVSTC